MNKLLFKYANGIYCAVASSPHIPSWEELFHQLVRGSSVYDEEIEELGEEEIFNHYAQAYEENLLTLQSLEGEECWRALAIEEQDCTTDHASSLNSLGVYWSRIREGADTYWGTTHPDCVFLYHTRVFQKAVDITTSLRMNMVNPDEDEIRFIPGSQIYVLDCMVYPTFSSESQVKIEDYRTC